MCVLHEFGALFSAVQGGGFWSQKHLVSFSAGDVNSIEVGSNTNIQDNAIVHVAKHSISGEAKPTIIGNNVTIGKWSDAQELLLWLTGASVLAAVFVVCLHQAPATLCCC